MTTGPPPQMMVPAMSILYPPKTIHPASASRETPFQAMIFSHSLGKQAHLPTRLAQSGLEHHERDDERDEQDKDGRRRFRR